MKDLLWPLARCGEAIEVVSRATRWLGPVARELPRYDGSAAEPWIAACATFLRVEAEPVVLSYATLGPSLQSLGPSLVLIDGALLAVVRTTLRHAIAIAPDGTRARVPLRELAGVLGALVEASFAADAERTLASIGTKVSPRARALLLRELAGDTPIGGVWILRASSEVAAPHVREGRIVAGILAFAASQIGQTVLLMVSWWILGAIAFGSGGDTGLFLVWLLVSLTMLPIRFLGTAAGRGAALATGSLLKRRLLAGALKLEPGEVHGYGIGAFMAHVLESGAVENLGSFGATIAVTAIATAIGTIVTLSLGAGGLAHAALFVAWAGVYAAITVAYYRARSAWTEARFALTGEAVEHLGGHKTRLVQQAAGERTESEDVLLSEYVRAEERVNRAALHLDMASRAWPWIALLGIAPQLIGGGYERTAMALTAGGILLGSTALMMWVDSNGLISAAAIAWRRLSRYWRTASRTNAPGSPSARATLDQPAAAGIPLVEMSSVTFRHANRERPTIEDATFAVAEGDRVLLEGRSGAGKSTLSLLMSGGRPLQSGLLFFRGLDMSTVGIENWRRRVMLAPQFYTNRIFSASLAYNLLFGRAWPPSQDDIAAAEAVCGEVGLGPLIARMPLGLEQTVGETGWQLSHGERTRVFLARVLLQEPALMILDETFAALDPETVSLAMESVLARPGAVVVIAHT